MRSLLLVLPLLVVALPADGQLYVVSQQTQEVLEYDASDGSFARVFAATITEGFRSPGDIALRPGDGSLYVSSIATGEIWSYTTATGQPILPAVSGDFFAPFGVGFDAAGDFLYVADKSTSESENSDAIKRLDASTGVVSTVGTNSQADFLGVAVNGSLVFATDVGGNRVLRFPVSGGNSTTVISSGLSPPAALLFATPTQMLVADSGSDRVLEYLESGGSWSFNREVLPASAGVDDPCGLALAPGGDLTVSGCQSGDVVLVDLTTLVVTPLVAPGAGGLSAPKGLAWSGSTLLVASTAANAVFYYDATGQPTGVRAEGLSASLDAGIEVSPDGSRVFVASIGSNDVLEHEAVNGARVRIFNQACPNLPLPFDSVLGGDGRLYVTCTLNSSVERFDADTGAALGSFVIAGAGGLVSPRGLAFGPSGNLFVASGSGAVLEFDAATGAAVPGPFVDANGNGGGPLDATGLRFHQGVLYVASFLHDEVMAFDATTGSHLSTFVTAGAGGLSGPRGLDFGPDGDLYVTSTNGDSVLRYDGSTGAFLGAFVAPGSGGLDAPFDLAFGSAPQVPAVPWLGMAVALVALAAVARWRLYGPALRKEGRS
jgi:DNA-binding beta-propeller fold protein YncE